MESLSLRFLRWSAVLMVVGLATGYMPLGHYLMGGANPSCPSAPVHGHVILLGWVGMALFALSYRALPAPAITAPTVRWARSHFWLAVVGTLGLAVNGTVGYSLLGMLSPGFYYQPEMGTLRIWYIVDGVFYTLYGAGCLIFAWIVVRATSKRGAAPA